jgi:hypothetical protein
MFTNSSSITVTSVISDDITVNTTTNNSQEYATNILLSITNSNNTKEYSNPKWDSSTRTVTFENVDTLDGVNVLKVCLGSGDDYSIIKTNSVIKIATTNTIEV